MKKYLLSTGKSTTKVEKYVLDLFKLNLAINPGDIPESNIGFKFIITDVKKDELKSYINSQLSDLASKIVDNFNNVKITIDNIEIINSETVRVNIIVNEYSESFNLGIYN